MRILMVRLSSIGDLVHTLPVLSALRKQYPDAKIDWLVERKFRTVLEAVTGIDSLVEVDTFSWRERMFSPKTWTDIARAIGRLRENSYDVVLDLQGTIKSSVAARLAKGERRIGFARADLKERPAALLYSEHVEVNGARPHVIDRQLRLLSAMDIDTTTRSFALSVPDSIEAAAASALDSLGMNEFVLLNPGGAWVTKRWSPEKFGALATAIRTRHGIPSLVLWAPGEEALAQSIVEHSDGACRLAPATGIVSLIPFAKRARVLVSGDTGPMHLASAFDVPIVGIFGPTDPARNGPFGTRDEIVLEDVPCGPCYKHRCPGYDNVCMTRIDVEDVLGAVTRQLERP